MTEIIETNSGTPEVNSDKRVYEVSALFVPELTATELSQGVESLKNKLSTLEAEIISEGAPLHIALAYTVEKHINNKIRRADYAHFYWVKFALDAANVQTLEAFLKLEMGEKIIRYLLIKTERANTILTELTEAKIADIKNEELIDEVLGTDLKKETELEKADASSTITDLGGEEGLKTSEDIEKTMTDEETKKILEAAEDTKADIKN
jgi:ribosomal protein S6